MSEPSPETLAKAGPNHDPNLTYYDGRHRRTNGKMLECTPDKAFHAKKSDDTRLAGATTRLAKRSTPQVLVALARKYTEEAIEGILEIARDETAAPAVRMKGWEIILERGYGKSPQAILVAEERVPGENGTVQELPIRERVKMLIAAKQVHDDEIEHTLDLEAGAITEVVNGGESTTKAGGGLDDLI